MQCGSYLGNLALCVLAKSTLRWEGERGMKEDLEEEASLQKLHNNLYAISYLHLEKDMWCVEFGRDYQVVYFIVTAGIER